MAEPIQTGAGYRRNYPESASSRALPVGRYVDPLRSEGLCLVRLGPATAIGSDPIEASNRLAFDAWLTVWRCLKLPGRLWPPAGELSGRLIHAVDPRLTVRGFGPSSKLLLMERPR